MEAGSLIDTRVAMSGTEMLQDGVHPIRVDDLDRLLEVWEGSVRATHDFLSESDIQFFKPMVLPGLLSLEHLLCARDLEGTLVAFVGVSHRKMEALFVHPTFRRAGLGRRLARHAVVELGATTVDVNEQNQQAVAFYRRLGFEIEGRSELDGTGKPFPLLHLRKHDGTAW
jgi:putative acetyltransferase